ncbi:MAG: 4'-phosphopantetheinyl transferase superfamily protein [Clostridia bacterium]|nr:4'-phosphopantetheinyl transferase superfamily protein [Clostridia bacterium]
MLKLYYTTASLTACQLPALMEQLSHARREQISARRDADAIASAAASCLLRYALCDAVDRALADAPIVWKGKPHFADPAVPVRFNLSHTVSREKGCLTAVVLLSDEGEVGVDTETDRPLRNRHALMQRLFSPSECAYADLPPDGHDRFFDLWCAKEAYIKWTGEGFSRPMSSVSVDVRQKSAESDGKRCDLRWISVDETVICAAAEQIPEELSITNVPITALCANQ